MVDHWQPQILQPIICQGFFVVLQNLGGANVPGSVVLQLGEHLIPIQGTFVSQGELGIKTIRQDRSLTATYPAAAWTQGAYVVVWGVAAPASAAPGVLH